MIGKDRLIYEEPKWGMNLPAIAGLTIVADNMDAKH
jgi:hypothetical protein